MFGLILSAVLAALPMPAAEPTPKNCDLVLREIAAAHEKAGHGEMPAQQVPNGYMFFWVDDKGTVYATAFLALPPGQMLTEGFFKKKGTCLSSDGVEVEYFSAVQAQ